MIQMETNADLIIRSLTCKNLLTRGLGKNFYIESSVEVQYSGQLNNESFMVCLHTKFMLNL